MSKEDYEKLLIEQIAMIQMCYKMVYPNGNFLEIKIEDDSFAYFNEHWGNDEEFPLNNTYELKGKHYART